MSHDAEPSPRRAARAEAERLATAALAQIPAPSPTRRTLRETAATPSSSPGRSSRLATALSMSGLAPVTRRRRLAALAGVALVAVVCASAIATASSGARHDTAASATVADNSVVAPVSGPPAVPDEGLPVPQQAAVAASATPCDDPAFTSALASGDDAAAISAAGGGNAFRAAVASGVAPCVSLSDPHREWVVVNKQRPYDPVDYRPDDLVMPDGVRALEQSAVRAPAATALSAMVRAASDAGAGEIGYLSAFRSYTTQQSTYAGRVAVGGVEAADRESARAGYSEHQSGLAVDIVPCDGSCATLDDVAASSQGAWVRDHAWEYGFITRYVEGRESVSGYEPEAWHLRYIGPELARAYHEGAYTTLEEFFGLPAAPTY
ncbi:M15 family metallopeptidase [Microbacterium trichothecenolyticum]|uniref:D-alanyl-D-alanine carboxypeptidase n=1 Tax=Microbacterium trichothecenolyticum TaxID=69370 RepID=A0ABU0TVB7_MICTR|nr:M15 family metallopeptidase [Microbacterium trichothecenolyticum]MDQ1123608.1 D-alanyl-D-alanine carboxypeptidase [Microbacterium trichothecenolyticum]